MAAILSTKRCSHCKRELPLSQFYKDRSASDGFNHCCRECKNARLAAYYHTHREHISKRVLGYRKAHREQVKEYNTVYHRTISGYASRLWKYLNERTVNGAYPLDSHRSYLNLGVRLEITRDELKALIIRHWDEVQAIWDSGESVHIHRTGPSIHYSADNIEFLSQSEHRARHSRPRYEDVGQT
jgi:hypothetical protein